MQKQFTPNEYVLSGDVAHIILLNQKRIEVYRAIVDAEDVDRVCSFARWYAATQAIVKGNPYVQSANPYARLHRFVLNAPRDAYVDHINHDPLDCRKANLRTCTPAENTWNRKGPTALSTSGVRGVQWSSQRNRWVVTVCANNVKHQIGRFRTLEEAEAAAIAGRRLLHGEFAT